MPESTSALRTVLHTTFYRSAFLALLLSGLAASATTPLLTLFLVRDLGASLSTAGLYFLTNLTAPVFGFVVGTISDRTENRLTLFRVCAIVSGLGWLAMSMATQVWMAFVIAAVALSVVGASSAQLFAATRDELSRRPTSVDARVMATIRMAFSIGFIVGPVVGSWFGSQFGVRQLLLASALVCFAQLLPVGRQRVARFVAPHEVDATSGVRPARAERARAMAPLLTFVGLSVPTMAGDTIKFAYLPIFMADQLQVSATTIGVAIGTQPVVEIVLMPVAAHLAERYGALRVLIVCGLFGVAANLAYTLSTSLVGVFVGQALMGVLWAGIAGLGVFVAQQLHPTEVGTASGLFVSAIMFAGAVGGVVGGIGVPLLGLPGVFLLPAGLTLVATVALFFFARRQARQVGLDPSPAGEPGVVSAASAG